MKTKLKKFFKLLFSAPGLNSLIRNAYMGLPNSQLELAKYYLFEAEDFLEAYAWADVASCRNLPGAHAIKQKAQEMLKPEQTKKAWDLARMYKQGCIPK
jgi:hypothetical protein